MLSTTRNRRDKSDGVGVILFDSHSCLSAILGGRWGFIVRFGSVNIVLSIALYVRKDKLVFGRIHVKKGVRQSLDSIVIWEASCGERKGGRWACSYMLFSRLHS